MTRPTPIDLAGAQLRLPLDRNPVYDRASFTVSDCNRAAWEALEAWPDWPGGVLVLFGPSAAGKTHLTHIWAERSGAAGLAAAPGPFDPPPGPLIVEQADRLDDQTLFALLDGAANRPGLLLTSRETPKTWRVARPDLISRLNALRAIELSAPDDTVFSALLLRALRRRHIRPEPDLIPYLLLRMERTAEAAERMAVALDEHSHALGRGINRALAREVLESLEKGPDLFA